MVCNPPGDVNTKPNPLTKNNRSTKRPSRESTSIAGAKQAATSGLANLRSRLQTEGISERAAQIITSGRTTGTYNNYESAWKIFSSWCEQRQVDPVLCPLKYILDYLTEMMDTKNREYRTINNHRSAISAFHSEVDGHKVGKHPRVQELLKGISYCKPPKPRLNAVWDVEILINHIEQQPHNNELSLKELTLKTTALLALTAIPRVSELAMLDTQWLIKKEDVYTFQLEGRAKHSKQGKPTPPIIFTKFTPNSKLCPLRTIDTYLEKTETLRIGVEGRSKLFLCYIKPYGPATKASIRRWLLEAMSTAGIDTQVYKAHSTRSSASSKAKSRGGFLWR